MATKRVIIETNRGLMARERIDERVAAAIAAEPTVVAAAADAAAAAVANDPALAPLATPGAEGEVLTVVSGVPDWAPGISQAALDARYAPAGCYLFAGKYGGRPSSSTSFDTVSTTSQTLPAGTYIWSGSTKLTASGDSTGSGWLLIRRNGYEVANGGAQLSFSGFTTLVTTFGGTFTLGSPEVNNFQGRWARGGGALIQHAADIAIVVQRIA